MTLTSGFTCTPLSFTALPSTWILPCFTIFLSSLRVPTPIWLNILSRRSVCLPFPLIPMSTSSLPDIHSSAHHPAIFPSQRHNHLHIQERTLWQTYPP